MLPYSNWPTEDQTNSKAAFQRVTLGGGRERGPRGPPRGERAQFIQQGPQLGFRHARSGAAGIDQLAVIPIVAEQQRAERGVRVAAEQKVGSSASIWSKGIADGCPMLGQDRDNDLARVEQYGFLLVCRELDEALSPEQEKSFNRQQSVTNVMGIA